MQVKTVCPYEEVEFQLKFNSDGTIDLVGIVLTGKYINSEFLVRKSVQLKLPPNNISIDDDVIFEELLCREES